MSKPTADSEQHTAQQAAGLSDAAAQASSGKAIPRHTWAAYLQQSTQPMFILSPNKRIRFVNEHFEKLVGMQAEELLGKACLRKGPTDDLFRNLSPTAEALKQTSVIRRAAPGKSGFRGFGPPWWDITFIPLISSERFNGLIGIINVVSHETVSMQTGQQGKSSSTSTTYTTSTSSSSSKANIPEELAAIRDRHGRHFSFELFSGCEKLMNQMRNAASQSQCPVWLVGDSGAGKETAARIIHHNSQLRDRAFFSWDCAAMPLFLVESILLGRGTLGESGKLGTIYLKHPELLSTDAQKQLLAWLENIQHSTQNKIRMISGSMENADRLTTQKKILPDFASRLAILEINLPPLTARISQLSRIVESWKLTRPLSAEAIQLIQFLPWPGNYRQLRDVLAHADGDEKSEIKPEHLPRILREKAELAHKPPVKRDQGPKLDDTLLEVEKRLLQLALQENNGNATKAADWLGIARTRFLRRADQLKINELKINDLKNKNV